MARVSNPVRVGARADCKLGKMGAVRPKCRAREAFAIRAAAPIRQGYRILEAKDFPVLASNHGGWALDRRG